MHLFAAKPGGFVDDEGIVDLQQSPAELIILSAADSSLMALAQAVDRLGAEAPELRLANWMNLAKPAAYDLYEDKVLEQARLVVVSLLGGQSYWPYGVERLQAWVAAKPERTLIIVPGCDAPDDDLLMTSSVPPEAAWQVWRYLREGGVDNATQLLHYLNDQWLGRPCEWQPPQPLPAALLYTPGERQLTLSQWQARHAQSDAEPCVLVFYRSHLLGANTAVIDGLIEQLQQQGLDPLPLAVTSLKDPTSLALLQHLVAQTAASVVLNTTSFAVNRGEAPLGDRGHDDPLALPGQPVVLQVMLASNPEEDWQQQSSGLRSRDMAMQVVLPEMDGRVITRAVGFKAEASYHHRCQLALIQHQLHVERAQWVAQLARRFVALRQTPNGHKRVALILANYPQQDGRIGNGVGLDTPASTLAILRAMAAEGYPVTDIPGGTLGEASQALMQWLTAGVTNDTSSAWQRASTQSLGLTDYLAFVATLPSTLQEAIWQRWGPPERDPKYRQGRLLVPGIRLGDTFVGIQPVRDFSDDPSLSYHDTDLVPPHSYIAFYAWLQHHYQAQAVIHVGKHGSLEWLPGKSVALSATCWPDLLLGPMPHFYPFIVNDPGEGAQAKRRTQAVIIDHLMPPLARAELYGPLAELESLADEYYQAMGMDPKREALLRRNIVRHLQATGLDREVFVHGDPEAVTSGDEEALLNALDAYLCDIKEAQIRQGLHIFGQLPCADHLASTLVAMLRLPQGQSPEQQSVLKTLSDDLALGDDFDPLTAGAEPWTGPQPAELQALDDRPWRTAADTRERLEHWAMHWMREQVVALDEARDHSTLATRYPRTMHQCAAIRQTLWPALQQSADQEMHSLLAGLKGQFVPPGPSGAPSRGRLDTLPTGRNFYTVDHRAIPSPAAWTLGQQSAQAFVERYLQDHGDFPRTLGLSIWGTATMRTGGDDIAQALALMGVKPIWAPGSQRVVDIEVVPSMLLNRPRVDVTLRVSGFFRDAFPNVMRLFDAAVQAVAHYEEPGEFNTLRQQIIQRQEQLQASGMSEEQAFRQASYRVFGSQPGQYGAGVNRLIDQRQWQQRHELGEAYIQAGAYAYGQQAEYGEGAEDAFRHQLGQLESVLHNQDNREHDVLDSSAYYVFQGGMASAVEQLRGQQPATYHADHANPAQPRIRSLKEELNRVVRSRVLNPKWIEGMRQHGYKGGFEMAATVDFLFAYDATTGLIDDHQYTAVAETLALSAENQAFLQQHNPAALAGMTERLLEAAQRGLWQAPPELQAALQDQLLAHDEQQELGGVDTAVASWSVTHE